ncbi:MAG: 16S rRNA (cytosine(1402)-N(4))-methyltransferase RsmH [candidate division WOR-3 bacterium]|jgi:16S rRNA (cytosine1402-N4)-methyltransferase
MAGKFEHVPVLVNEVVEVLKPCLSVGTIIDATVGGGGHLAALAQELIKFVPEGKRCCRLLGIDVDAEAIAAAGSRLSKFGCQVLPATGAGSYPGSGSELPMIVLMKASYVNINEVVEKLRISQVSGVLMDLGLSSFQLQPERGFSFEQEGPLDMRFDRQSSRLTARELLHRAKEGEIYTWLRTYGEEPLAKRISRQIYKLRGKIESTRELVQAIAQVVPKRRLKKTLARVFQALRIVVNDELTSLKVGLKAAIELLRPKGRLVVICYQSGEDRCFKAVVREHRDCLRTLTKKPVFPEVEEVRRNPRARSARLRAVEKVL